jgi:CubicO group peptidase (beta-lactamase class C family)
MSQLEPLNLDQLGQQLPEHMRVAGVPGLVMTVIAENRIAATHAFGVKSTAIPEPVAPDTVFQAASLSKPVFTYAVLQLWQEGVLDLDRPLDSYLPLAETDYEPQLHQITARHALSHTSGLQNWRFEPADRLQVAFPFGKRFSYSGEGYFFLQRVVEQLTGQGIEAFLQERVLRPLGMQRSSYIWRAEHAQQISMGHRDRDQPAEPWNAWQGRRMLELAAQWEKPLPSWRYEDVVQALPDIHAELAPLPNNMIPNVAGSLLTTAPEYAQFMLQMLEAAPDLFGHSADSVRRTMLTPQIQLNSVLSWGLGWGLERSGDQTYFWHWGENGVFENFALGDSQRGSGVVILTNAGGGLKLCERIVQQITGRDLAAFAWLLHGKL